MNSRSVWKSAPPSAACPDGQAVDGGVKFGPFGMLRAASGAQSQDGVGRTSVQVAAGRHSSGAQPPQSHQVFGQQLSDAAGLRRDQRHRRVPRRLHNRRFRRHVRNRTRQTALALSAV